MNSSTDTLLSSLAGKRVLITGSSGYVGGELSRRLAGTHVNALGIDKLVGDSPIEQLAINLNDKDALRKVVREFRPEIIVHAGTNSALQYQHSYVPAFEEDWCSIKNLHEVIGDKGKTRTVFFSSSYVYSGCTQQGVVETAQIDPLHNFGQAKKFFEQMLLRNFGNCVIFRLSSVFGPGTPRCPNAIENILEECTKTGQAMVWGQGTRRMQYVYMDDVLRNVGHAPELDAGIYNLGANEYLSLKEVVTQIAALTQSTVVLLPEKPEGESLVRMNSEKIKARTAEDFTPVQDALGNYISEKVSAKPAFAK